MFYAKAAGFQNDVECNGTTPELQQLGVQCLQCANTGNAQSYVGYGYGRQSGYPVKVEFLRGLTDRYPYLKNIFALSGQIRTGAPSRRNVPPANLISLLPARQSNARFQKTSINFTS